MAIYSIEIVLNKLIDVTASMDKEAERQRLIREARELDKEIAKFNLTEDERKRERIKLLHQYNETKDSAQRILGALAEIEGVSTGVLYKRFQIETNE